MAVRAADDSGVLRCRLELVTVAPGINGMSWVGKPATNSLTADSAVGVALAVDGGALAVLLCVVTGDDVVLGVGVGAPEHPDSRRIAAKAVAAGRYARRESTAPG